MFVVCKSMTADGIIRRTGEVVQATSWRHVKRLMEQRYLSVFDGEPVKCAKCGRMFVDENILKDHIGVEHFEWMQEEQENQTQTEEVTAAEETKIQKSRSTKRGG